MLAFLNGLGYAIRIRLAGQFITKDLPQLWQTLGKILARCLTTRETGVDQPSLQIMKMLYHFIHKVHVDYVVLIWEGLHYSHMHPTTLIPYPRFTTIIVDHILIEHPDILQRLNEPYHIVENDEQVVKKVEEHLINEDIEKIMEGDDEIDTDKFVDDVLNIIMEYLVKEDTVYLCLHFTEDHKGTRSNTPYPEELNTPYSSYRILVSLVGPLGDPWDQQVHSKGIGKDSNSGLLAYKEPLSSKSPNFNLFSDQEEFLEEEFAEIMAETMEQYMSKTRADYGSGIARPKIENKDSFELKG
ncbi:hypothetical protein Tco_0429545 [Tanacetum coccineum]